MISLREKYLRCDLQIEKATVIHQDQERSFSRLLHILIRIGKLHLTKVRDRGYTHDETEDTARLFRFLMGRTRQRHHFIIVHLTGLDLHVPGPP